MVYGVVADWTDLSAPSVALLLLSSFWVPWKLRCQPAVAVASAAYVSNSGSRTHKVDARKILLDCMTAFEAYH